VNHPAVELLVLDVHGVVLSDHLPKFLEEFADLNGEPVDDVRRRWRKGIRTPAWKGEIDDAELWRRLSGVEGEHRWRDQLEAGYQLGPAAPHLGRWSARVPIWLLSNHRTGWLLPRLKRFGIDKCFERVLVSDEIGAAKPDAGAFALIGEHVGQPQAALFVDDQMCNIEAARQLGFRVVHAAGPADWIAAVDACLDSVIEQSPCR
jgi:FMN phosphatase YigB (HAD superfamily)